MSDTNKTLNFFKNDVFYIHGAFDDTITINIIPELRNKITEIIKQQDIIKDNKNFSKDEQSKQLELLSKDKKIIFDINSNGGNAYILFALLNSINFAKSKSIIVETYCHYAASCASLLAICGTKKYRYISSLSVHYIHQGSNETGRVYTHKQLDRRNESIKRDFDILKKLYLDNSTYSKDELDEIFSDDHYEIYSQDIIKYGLADKIL